MRVAVVGGWAPSLIKFRGPLLAALVSRGHQVFAMAADGDDATTRGLADLGATFVPISVERASSDPLADVRLVAELRRLFARLQIDQTFGYTIKPVVYGSLAARAAGVPRRAAMITGLGYVFAKPTNLRHRAVATIAHNMYRLGLAQCQTVFFQNPDDQHEFESRRLLRPSTNITRVRGSGVDVAHYQVAPLPAGPLQFLFIGRLLTDKGIRDYVEMARRVRAAHPDTRFRVVGWCDPNPNSVSPAELDRWVAEGTIDYVGALQDVRPLIAQSHVLVLPSYREGTPRSVLEAMSMGRAVITTDAPGCRETVVHGESGLLVPVRDPDSLVAAANQLIASPQAVANLGRAARNRIEQLYDATAVASHMLTALGL